MTAPAGLCWRSECRSGCSYPDVCSEKKRVRPRHRQPHAMFGDDPSGWCGCANCDPRDDCGCRTCSKLPAMPHCLDCGSTDLHEGPNDPPPWCCCMDCGSANISDGKEET